MSTVGLETIAEEMEQLTPEERWTLLSLLIESLRRQDEPPRPLLRDYCGLGKGRGFQTAQEVDKFIEKERASWEN